VFASLSKDPGLLPGSIHRSIKAELRCSVVEPVSELRRFERVSCSADVQIACPANDLMIVRVRPLLDDLALSLNRVEPSVNVDSRNRPNTRTSAMLSLFRVDCRRQSG
jgi:hypothetical protein